MKPSAELELARECLRLAEETAPVGSLWRHEKTGGIYRVVSHVVVEATCSAAIGYRLHFLDRESDIEWVRPAREFFERFRHVTIDDTPGARGGRA